MALSEASSTRISNHPNSRTLTSFARLNHMQCLGQFAKGFFVGLLDGCFYIIDQHAASEKVLYERYLSELQESHSNQFEFDLPK